MNDRRRYLRFKKVMDAVVVLDDREYPAQTHDINQLGLSLLIAKDFPEATHYAVNCRLQSGRSARFEVLERRRMVLRKDDHQFLRLNLEIINESLDIVEFFRDLAKTVQEVMFRDSGPINDDSIDLTEWETLPGLEQGTRAQLVFRLDAVIRHQGHDFACQTLALSPAGLVVWIPESFPEGGQSYPLSCRDASGEDDVSLLVRERARRPVDEATVSALGVKATAGSLMDVEILNETAAFRALIAKYGRRV